MTTFDSLSPDLADPQTLEQQYRTLTSAESRTRFTQQIEAAYSAEPHNLLYAAWHYRLQGQPDARGGGGSAINWLVAVPISLVLALIFWVSFGGSDADLFLDTVPYLFLIWAPLAAVAVLGYVATTARGSSAEIPWSRVGIAVGALTGLTLAALLLAPRLADPDHYLQQTALNLPILAWAAIGFGVAGLHARAKSRFSFLTKSLDALVVGGVFAILLGMFSLLTITMFDALGVLLPDRVQQLLIFGSMGLVPVLAVALVYDPTRAPLEQDFEQGLGRVVAMLFRILLPLTLMALLAYVVAIAFNFQGAFENRNTLIVYNVVQFAVIGLLLAATPISAEGLAPRTQTWLKWTILAIAALALLVSLYALSAIVTRTLEGNLTMNRFTFIGWNLINIALLAVLLWRQLRSPTDWLAPIYQTYSQFAVVYALWAMVTLLVVPVVFA